jgi:hypothetical protein
MYFGSALSKLRNFGGGFEPPNPNPLGTPLKLTNILKKINPEINVQSVKRLTRKSIMFFQW